jgi:predicted enzyme related to lactoylglutathione lyase
MPAVTPPVGAPVWVDLMSSDLAASRDFYTALLGWEAEEPNPEFGGYFNFTRHGVRVAGCMSSQPEDPVRDIWSVYLHVEDAAKTLETAAAHGAQIIVPAMPVADLGTMGVLIDGAGAAIGVWQPGTHKGFGVAAEPGAPAWFEVLTNDYRRTIDFYRDVFGSDVVTMSDSGDFRYSTINVDGEETAGIMDASAFLPEGVPSHWSVYFAVADTDASVAQALAAGATILEPATDTPYGRMAHVIDPNGARVRLIAGREG